MYGAIMKGFVERFAQLGGPKGRRLLSSALASANEVLHARERTERPECMRSFPTHVEIELTNRCNYSCAHCLRPVHVKDCVVGDISFDAFERIIAQFPRVTRVSLSGIGEPLLHPLLFEFAALTRRRLPSATIAVETNGALVDRVMAGRLLASELNEIIVGIDAAFPKTYRKVRRGGSLDTVQRNLCNFVEMRSAADSKRPLLGLSYVMLEENEDELVSFVEQAAEIGVDFIDRVSFATRDWGVANRRTAESYRRELSAARLRLDELRLPSRSFPSHDFSWASRERPFDCGNPWGASVYVTFEGAITLGSCTPFKELYSYGNILTTPFQEIWNGPLFRYNRQRARDAAAPNTVCGACHAHASAFFEPRSLDARVIRLPLLPRGQKRETQG